MSEETPAQRMKRALDEHGEAWYNARFRKITLTADDIATLRYKVRHAPGTWITTHGRLIVHAPEYDVDYEYGGEGVDWAFGCPNEMCCSCCGCTCYNEYSYMYFDEEEPE